MPPVKEDQNGELPGFSLHEKLYQLPVGPVFSPWIDRLPIHSIDTLDFVDGAHLRQENPDSRATRSPPAIDISTTNSPPNAVGKLESAGSVRNIPTLTPTVDENPATVITPTGEYSADFRIVFYWHPLATPLQNLLQELEGVEDVTAGWKPDKAKLSPNFIGFHRVAPLRLGVSYTSDDMTSTRRQVSKHLKQAIAAEEPLSRYAHIEFLDEGCPLYESTHDDSISIRLRQRECTTHESSRVFQRDGRELPSLITGESLQKPTGENNETVQLTVTSPPYSGVIDYDQYGEGDWSNGKDSGNIESWLSNQREIFTSLYSITRNGGYCAIVIGSVKKSTGVIEPLPHKFVQMMEDIGWVLEQEITWDKVTSRNGSFGTTVQNPYPSYYYPNEQTEQIQIWRKGPLINRRDEESKFEITEIMKQEMSCNVWHIPPVPHNDGIEHPCPFPEEIVHRLVLFYSNKGDIVADPMAGSGTVLKVADRLERKGIGTEIRPEFVSEARHRLATEEYDRRDQLIPTYSKLPACSDEANVSSDSQSQATFQDFTLGS